jgi:hypothetical protein
MASGGRYESEVLSYRWVSYQQVTEHMFVYDEG